MSEQMEWSRAAKRVAIIGAGSSGLASARTASETYHGGNLRQALLYGYEPIVFERRGDIGGWWRFDADPHVNTVAQNTTLLCSREEAGFSDYKFPSSASQPFMHHTQVLSYLDDYAREFELLPHIKLNSEVVGIGRAEDWERTGVWCIEYRRKGGDRAEELLREAFAGVLICTGQHNRPWRPPPYRMETAYRGRITHSMNYKGPARYEGKRVAIVGFGNSAVSIACDLAPVAGRVYLSTRRGGWLLPLLDPDGQPWDRIYNSRLHSAARHYVPKPLRNLLWCYKLSAVLHEKLGLRPRHRFLDAGITFAQSLPLHIASGRVIVKPDLLSFTETGLEFEDAAMVEPIDEVIFCTGFEFDFPFVEEGSLIRVRYNDFHLYKHMFPPELDKHNSLAVIGHVQLACSLFPAAEMQARLFFQVFSGQSALPSRFEMKAELERKRCDISLGYLKTRRHTQMEDFIGYIDELRAIINHKKLS